MSKKTSEWKDKLNRRFDIKQSISGRWIYCLNDSDDEENEYSFLDEFISDLLAKEKMELVERIEEDVLAYDCPIHMASCPCHAAIEKQQNQALSALKSEEKEED